MTGLDGRQRPATQPKSTATPKDADAVAAAKKIAERLQKLTKEIQTFWDRPDAPHPLRRETFWPIRFQTSSTWPRQTA